MDSIPDNIKTKGESNVTFPVPNGEDAFGYLSPFGEDSKVGLVFIQEWWGMNKSITITADRFAKFGLRVICVDVYRGKVAQDREEAGHLMSGLDFAGAALDCKSAGDYLRSLGCTKVFITGFCMGGALALVTVANYGSDFDGAIPFYGVPDLNTVKFDNVKCPMLANFATQDQLAGFSDPDTARRLESVAKAANIDFELKLWEANHAFMNQDSVNYNSTEAEKALEYTVEFIRKHSS